MHTMSVYETHHTGLKANICLIYLDRLYPLLNFHLTGLTNGLLERMILIKFFPFGSWITATVVYRKSLFDWDKTNPGLQTNTEDNISSLRGHQQDEKNTKIL